MNSLTEMGIQVRDEDRPSLETLVRSWSASAEAVQRVTSATLSPTLPPNPSVRPDEGEHTRSSPSGDQAARAGRMVDDGDSPLGLEIHELARALRDRAVTSVGVVTECLERIERYRELGAFTVVFAEEALHRARKLDSLLEAGQDLGPLHGVPVSIKDNIDLEGWATRAGGVVLGDSPAPQDAHVVAALKRAGAIIVGKNNMHELAWGGTTENPWYGTARNPWDPSRSASGSSGGSAVAVAARMVFGAIGSDTGGSIRNPAAMNGVCGIRPTFGTVSNRGVFPLAWSLDVTGPLARSSRDCAILLETISGQDQLGPRPRRGSGDSSNQLDGLRVRWLTDYPGPPPEAGVEEAFEDALSILEGLGAMIAPIQIAGLDALVDALVVTNAVEPSSLHRETIRTCPEKYGDAVRVQLMAGLMIGGSDYVAAQRYRRYVRNQVKTALSGFDALVTPSLGFMAPTIGWATRSDHAPDAHLRSMQFSALASVTGLPALTVPMGYVCGLPVGLQIIAGESDEATAFEIGHAYQTATSFHRREPALVAISADWK